MKKFGLLLICSLIVCQRPAPPVTWVAEGVDARDGKVSRRDVQQWGPPSLVGEALLLSLHDEG